MKIDDLRTQLAELDAKMQEILKDENRTAEQIETLKTLSAQAEELIERIETEERAQSISASLRQPEGDGPNTGDPNNGEQRGFEDFGMYLQAVAAALMARGARLGEFPTGISDRRLTWQDPELRSTGLEEATPSLGGFLVQKDFSNTLLEKAHAASILYGKTTQIPISARSNGLKIPAIDETSRADGSRGGGFRAFWLEEGGTKTASTTKFMMVELNLHKLIGLCYATDELLEDASALGAIIREGFAKEFSFKIDNAILDGTGSGQPLGVLRAPCLVSVTGGSSAGTIVSADIVGVYKRMFPASLPRAEWYCNVDSLDYLMGLNTKGLTTVDTMDGMPLWLPSNQVAGRPFQTLFGKPIHYIEQCKATGTLGDLLFADFSQYITITKGGMQSASSIHVQFTTDETAFRFVFRIDGQPWWNNALTPFQGSDTQSPFVAIATRT